MDIFCEYILKISAQSIEMCKSLAEKKRNNLIFSFLVSTQNFLVSFLEFAIRTYKMSYWRLLYWKSCNNWKSLNSFNSCSSYKFWLQKGSMNWYWVWREFRNKTALSNKQTLNIDHLPPVDKQMNKQTDHYNYFQYVQKRPRALKKG